MSAAASAGADTSRCPASRCRCRQPAGEPPHLRSPSFVESPRDGSMRPANLHVTIRGRARSCLPHAPPSRFHHVEIPQGTAARSPGTSNHHVEVRQGLRTERPLLGGWVGPTRSHSGQSCGANRGGQEVRSTPASDLADGGADLCRARPQVRRKGAVVHRILDFGGAVALHGPPVGRR